MVDQTGTNPTPIAAADSDEAADGSDYLAAYAGLSWPSFAPVYPKIWESGAPVSWSFTLFFFPWIWLVYRKMPQQALVVWAVEIASFRLLHEWGIAVTLPISVAVGLFGRGWFVRRATFEVVRVRKTAHDKAAALAALKDQGIARGGALFGLVIPMLIIGGIVLGY